MSFDKTALRIGRPIGLLFRSSQRVAVALHRGVRLIEVAEFDQENAHPPRSVVTLMDRCPTLGLQKGPQGVFGLAGPAIKLALQHTCAIDQWLGFSRLGKF